MYISKKKDGSYTIYAGSKGNGRSKKTPVVVAEGLVTEGAANRRVEFLIKNGYKE